MARNHHIPPNQYKLQVENFDVLGPDVNFLQQNVKRLHLIYHDLRKYSALQIAVGIRR